MSKNVFKVGPKSIIKKVPWVSLPHVFISRLSEKDEHGLLNSQVADKQAHQEADRKHSQNLWLPLHSVQVYVHAGN